MAKRKALIIHGSITGNTKLVAEEFAKVCDCYGFQAELVKVDPRRDWDKDPVFVENYDLVCLRSPIIAGLPYKEVSMLMGLQGEEQVIPGSIPGVHYGTGIEGIVCPSTGTGTPGSKNEPSRKTIYGISFCTYGGSGVGPEECYGTLETLVEFLRVNGIRCVGKFACPGKELRHNSVDALASILKMNIDESQELMQRFKENPYSEEFKTYSQVQLDTFKKMASVKDEESFGDDPMMVNNDPMGIGKPGSVCWHYDFQHRPSSRDISKANIFLKEIIEDYFLTFTGDPRPPFSTYTCIG